MKTIKRGIAKAVINGKGIFKGSVNKEFSIAKATDEVHTSQAVTDSAKQQPVLKTD